MVFLILDTNHNWQSNISLSPSKLFGQEANYEFQDKADHPQQCSLLYHHYTVLYFVLRHLSKADTYCRLEEKKDIQSYKNNER